MGYALFTIKITFWQIGIFSRFFVIMCAHIGMHSAETSPYDFIANPLDFSVYALRQFVFQQS